MSKAVMSKAVMSKAVMSKAVMAHPRTATSGCAPTMPGWSGCATAR